MPTELGLQPRPATTTKIRLFGVFSARLGHDWLANSTNGLMVESLTTRSLKDDY
jgi:hypothetical protein